MVFSSALFLIYFFPVFFIVYFLFPNHLKNLWALTASVLFYLWGGSDFFLILCISVLIDFVLTSWMDTKEGKLRQAIAVASAASNFLLLGYFKYADFFVENFNLILENKITLPQVILPIGISFFTFHKVSYVIDIYYKKCKPLKNISDFFLYILLFPQLIAGPIIRFNEIADQILDRKNSETWENRLRGFFRFCLGLSRKILFANVLGKEADRIFALGESELTFFLAWTGILAYTFQIYFDFAGYSDMALGLGRMMGFQFPENFHFPYTSGSITEFWRRWHITLGNWMRDYIYIPLGGNKVAKFQTYLNLWAVFLFSGLWHGASWTFILWGAYHGFFISLEKFFQFNVKDEAKNPFKILFTFFLVLNGWVLFRAETLSIAFRMWKAMYSPLKFGSVRADGYFVSFLILSVLFSFYPVIKSFRKFSELDFGNSGNLRLYTIVAIALFSVSLGEVLSTDFNPFIYFRF